MSEQTPVTLRIHPHKLSFVHRQNSQLEESKIDILNQLIEPVPLIEIPYGDDLKVEIVRHVSNILLLQSAECVLQMCLASNTDRDLITLLIRNFYEKFKLDPVNIKSHSDQDYYQRKETQWKQGIAEITQQLSKSNSDILNCKDLNIDLDGKVEII